MAIQRVTLSGTLTADAYRSLADLFGFSGTRANIVEGFLQAQTFAGTMRIVPRGSPAPATADGGLALIAGAAIGLGPIKALDAGVALEEVWVRNTAAGSNAAFLFWGVLEVEA